MCNCKNTEIGSYDNQVELEVPKDIMLRYNNPENNIRNTVCIDKCLVDEIKKLWSEGIITTGCCCGHNKQKGYIGVKEEYISKMVSLGYKVRFNECRPDDKDSFIPFTK